MLIGLVVASFLGLILNSYYASKCIPYSVREQIKDIMQPIAICSIPGFVMYLITFLGLNIYLQLVVQLLIGVLIFGVVVKMTGIKEYYFMKEIIVSLIFKLIRK